MKKLLGSVIVGSLLITATVVFAEEQQVNTVSPESDLYETVRLIEESEVDLTEEYVEKALLEDEQAEKRLAEAEMMLEVGNDEVVDRLLEDYNNHMEEINKNLELGRELGEDITKVESLVAEKASKRSENLKALLEKEDLPQEAKAGITKALENQEKAMENFTAALEKANQAREAANERTEQADDTEEGQEEQEVDTNREQRKPITRPNNRP